MYGTSAAATTTLSVPINTNNRPPQPKFVSRAERYTAAASNILCPNRPDKDRGRDHHPIALLPKKVPPAFLLTPFYTVLCCESPQSLLAPTGKCLTLAGREALIWACLKGQNGHSQQGLSATAHPFEWFLPLAAALRKEETTRPQHRPSCLLP